MAGYIKLHRSIEENEFYFSERFTKAQAWVDLLLLANHRPNTMFVRGVEIQIETGQLARSQITLAKRWKWNRRTVKQFLNMLEKRQMIHTRLSNITTIISILNWPLYQGDAQQTAHQNAQQSNTRMHTNKNDKNDKKVVPPIPPEINTPEFQGIWDSYRQHRREMRKPLTQNAEMLALKKVLKFSRGDPKIAIEIVAESVSNGWQGLFELKGQNGIHKQGNRQTEQIRRATFTHGEAEVNRLRDFEETMRERDRERSERS